MIKNKCYIIGNSVEPFWEKNIYKAKESINDNKIIKVLCVAKIRPVKNITKACEAIKVLNDSGLNVQLTVIGENQDNEEYKRIISYDNVKVLDFMDKEMLLKEYRKNDIFLLPSINETFGRSYVEAMTQGLPVIYSKGQGFDGKYANGYVGYAIDPNNANEIADAIQNISKDINKFSINCINSCGDFFQDNITKKMIAFYNDALFQND